MEAPCLPLEVVEAMLGPTLVAKASNGKKQLKVGACLMQWCMLLLMCCLNQPSANMPHTSLSCAMMTCWSAHL
jgi:hypothetical protein